MPPPVLPMLRSEAPFDERMISVFDASIAPSGTRCVANVYVGAVVAFTILSVAFVVSSLPRALWPARVAMP